MKWLRKQKAEFIKEWREARIVLILAILLFLVSLALLIDVLVTVYVLPDRRGHKEIP